MSYHTKRQSLGACSCHQNSLGEFTGTGSGLVIGFFALMAIMYFAAKGK